MRGEESGQAPARLRLRARVFALKAWRGGVSPADFSRLAHSLGLPITAREYLAIARAYVDALDETVFIRRKSR